MSAENTKSSFGYEGDFLCGKPIDIILSQPYREHNSAFGTTPLNDESGESHGKSTDLSFAGQLETLDGKSVMQEGQHKDLASEPFPIRLSISNVGDGMFMVLVDEFKEMCTSITMDVKGNIKSSVKLLEEMFGYDLDYIKTCNVSTLFPPEIQEVGQPPPLESDSEDQLVVRNLIGRHKNGSRFYCTMQLKATRAMGRLVLYLGNLTKLDPTLEALVILDVKEHILSYSQSYFNSLFGYKKDELVGMNMKSIITRKKRERNNSSMNVQRKRKSREEGVGGNDNNSGEKRSKKRSPSVSTDSAQKTSPPAGVSAVIKSTEESIVPQRHVDTSGTLHMKHKDGSQVPIHLEMIPFQNGEGEWRICMKIKRVALKEKPKEKEKREKYLGPWLMMDLLGEGVSGKVMSAKHRETGQTVAIKTIQKRKLDGPEIERTKREVKIMSKLSHENIIKLYDVIETDHKLNIVMELIDPSQGSDLMDYITKRDHLSEEESKGLFRQILASIHHCHKDGIVHRGNLFASLHRRELLICTKCRYQTQEHHGYKRQEDQIDRFRSLQLPF